MCQVLVAVLSPRGLFISGHQGVIDVTRVFRSTGWFNQLAFMIFNELTVKLRNIYHMTDAELSSGQLLWIQSMSS